MCSWIEWSSSKSLLTVKTAYIFNSTHLLRNILSTLRESSRFLDKCSKRFRLLLWRWRLSWSTDFGSSVKNCSKVSSCSRAPKNLRAQLSTRKYLTCWKNYIYIDLYITIIFNYVILPWGLTFSRNWLKFPIKSP